MDPRLLLNPKALKKDGMKSGSDKDRSKSSKISSANLTSPKSSPSAVLVESDTSPRKAPAYDPRALLNPKGVRSQHSNSDRSKNHSETTPMSENNHDVANSSENTSTKHQLQREDSGSRNMVESLYGIERRVDQPRKKVKVTATNDDAQNVNSHSTYSRHSNGVIGEYMKPKTDDGKGSTNLMNLIDLTEIDDSKDDDIQVVSSRNLNHQEVCFGQVRAVIHAYLIPKPKAQSLFNNENEWPVMKCKLVRSAAKDTVIEVIDPSDRAFGKVNLELATALAPAMDGLIGLRTQARLTNRRKKPTEWPHQPCSETLNMIINIYGRRGDVDKIGKLFGHHNIWFRPPMAPENGIPIVNPHANKKPMATPIRTAGRGNVLSDTRTLEEATEAVSKLFDYFAEDNISILETEGPDSLTTTLLPHQKQALTFMLQHEKPRTYGEEESENSSLWRREHKANGKVIFRDVVSGLSVGDEPDQVFGGLLADVMGLGKTLEALSLIASTFTEAETFSKEQLLRSDDDNAIFRAHSKATLVVCPTSTVKNWEDQIKEHAKPGMLTYYVYHGPNRTKNVFELVKYDIVIATYGVISSEFTGRGIGGSKSPLKELKWFRIILDEAHTIREPKAIQSQAVYSLWAQRRWCLTGTPIQNRIDDLGSLTRFLRLYPYDTAARFNQYIRAPAQAGDPAFLKALRVFVDSFTLRRLRDRINLPKRTDMIEKLALSNQELVMHDFFKDIARVQIQELAKSKERRSGVQHHVLQGIMTLRLICAHGRDLLKSKDLEKLKGSTINDAINLEEEQALPSITKRAAYENLSLMAEANLDLCKSCDKQLSGETPQAEIDDAEKGAHCYVLPCFDTICADCFSPHKQLFDDLEDDEPIVCHFCHLTVKAQYVGIAGSITEILDSLPQEEPASMKKEVDLSAYSGPHTKTLALLRDIAEMQEESKPLLEAGEPPIKCVVFSEFTSHLDLIGRALTDNNHTFVRIDGSMSLNKRRVVLDALASDNNVTILLASIKAAGQGLNLTAASRAFIMEPMWNPAAEAQAVDRIYRIGQTREVIVKRFQMEESIEMKIVELQKKKQKLADISMNRNHKQLSKQEIREQHMKDILSLFK